MTKERAYLELAKRYFTKNHGQLEFVCVDLKGLFIGKSAPISSEDLINLKDYPELFLFSIKKNQSAGAWMTGDATNIQELMQIKGWALLFAIEMLNDEKKIQKKSKTGNLR